jgi:tellurite resistance protein
METDRESPPNLDALRPHAETFRRELNPSERRAVLELAVEAGYLAGAADGEVDAAERAAIARAVETLFDGDIDAWDVESLLDACWRRLLEAGAGERARAVGEALGARGEAEAGLLFAALVASASGGVGPEERHALEAIATAAGVAPTALAAVVARATLPPSPPSPPAA